MAGTAKTDKFMLSTATIMIGPMADLHSLNPTEHSIGLAKNVIFTTEPGFVELSQGLQNDIVASVKNADNAKVSGEVYEYSPQNLAYASGLDATGVTYAPYPTIYTASSAATTSVVIVGVDTTAEILDGDYIFIQQGIDDYVHIAKVASSVFAVSDTTLTLEAGYAIPVGTTFTTGARVSGVRRIDVGGTQIEALFSCKIVGLMPKDNRPFVLMMPKVKITNGMSISFSSDNFSNLPFELTLYAGLPSDPLFTEFGSRKMSVFPG